MSGRARCSNGSGRPPPRRRTAPRRAARSPLSRRSPLAARRVRGCARAATARSARGGRTAARRAPASRGTRPGGCSGDTRGCPPSAALKDSSTAECSCPSAPGSLRRTASHSDHRRQLAAAEHVAPDRDDVAGEVLEDALVEALVAPAQQRQRRLGRQLVRRARRRAAARRAPARSPAGARAASPGRRRSGRAARCPARPRAAPSRRRRRTACRRPGRRSAAVCSRKFDAAPASSPPASTLATWRCAANHSNHSGNSVKTSISHRALLALRSAPRRGGVLQERQARCRPRCAARASTLRIASLTIGTEQRLPRGPSLRRTSSTSQEGSSIRPLTVAEHAARRRAPRSPPVRAPTTRPRRAPARPCRSTRQLHARAAPRRRARSSTPSRRTIGRWSVPGAAHDLGAPPATVTLAPSVSSRGRGPVT